MSPDHHVACINRRPTASKRDRSPAQLAAECLAEIDNDPERAIALAGKCARGAKLRAVHAAIGNTLLRAS